MKTIFVALAWICLALAIHFGLHGTTVTSRANFVVFIASAFILLVSDTLLLDLRDRVGDRKNDIWSFPKTWDSQLPQIVFWINAGVSVFVGFLSIWNSELNLTWDVLVIAHAALAVSARLSTFVFDRALYLIVVSSWLPVSAAFTQLLSLRSS